MIAWFARNGVAVNFLMLAILAAGAFSLKNSIPLEVFPSREFQQVNISVSQRGATPEDMELGITNRIEEAVADLPYVDELRSRTSEASSAVTVDLLAGTDRQRALNEIKTRIDALSTLPQSAERPVVEVPRFNARVLNLIVSGNIDEKELAHIVRRLRDDLVQSDGVTIAEIEGVRPYEIGIEVEPATLRAYDLTLQSIANAVREQSLDVSAGQVKSNGGEILLRAKQQAYYYRDYNNIIVKRFADGSVLRLGDVATVDDGFDENPLIARFNGKPAANIKVFRVGNESAISVSDAVMAFLDENRHRYPNTVEFGIWDNNSEIVKERLNTLLTSGWQGAILIAILLSLFLHPSVALWVVIGIPVCFAGALALFPVFGLTINALSLFAFILVLGVVVDDAIVTGENIYEHRRRGSEGIVAAIEGTKEIATPVIFGVVTTMLAFVPLLMLPEDTSFFGTNMAGVVIPVLVFSLIESKFILPNHLRHLNLQRSATTGFLMGLENLQRRISDGLLWVISHVYAPLVKLAIRWRYATMVLFSCILYISISLISTGWVKSSFMPRVAADTATATINFPAGTAFSITEAAVTRMEEAAFRVQQQFDSEEGQPPVVKNVLTIIGSAGGRGGISGGRSHLGRVQFEVHTEAMEQRNLRIKQLVDAWRKEVGVIPGAEKLTYRSVLFDSGRPVFVQLEGRDVDELSVVAQKIREKLETYDGVYDIEDTLQRGKRQLLIELKPEAELLGLSTRTLTQQVRSAFFGEQAQRIQRGRDDVRVMVRYPLDERKTLSQLENLLISTPNGGEARFGDLATITWDTSPTSIYHVNQLRTSRVMADVNPDKVSAKTVNDDLREYMKQLALDHPAVGYGFDGQEKSRAEFMSSFMTGVLGILVAIFGLLAIAFRSYYQPMIIMSVIPFAIIGAIVGHMILGIGWTLFSYMGLMALIGVVVNDSLVLVDWINRKLALGNATTFDVVIEAGKARFRAVILTSLTTFFGLMPILFQTSIGSAFLKPMAVSLGCGILFATFLTLLLVPCNYMIWQDIRWFKRWLFNQDYKALEQQPSA